MFVQSQEEREAPLFSMPDIMHPCEGVVERVVMRGDVSVLYWVVMIQVVTCSVLGTQAVLSDDHDILGLHSFSVWCVCAAARLTWLMM